MYDLMAKLAIILPTFNAAATIEQALSSIAIQTNRDFEVIVVDGGSRDDTVERIKKFSTLISILISEKDMGIYDAMNKGVSLANSEFILFLGADDALYDKNVLTHVLPLLIGQKVYYGETYFLKRRKTYDGKFSVYKLALRNICHQAIFYPANLLKETKYSLQYPLLADFHMNLQLVKKGVPFVFIDYIIANFNDNASSASSSDTAFEKDKLQMVKECLGTMPYLYAVSRRIVKRLLR
jgi:glycosyltransferase involved in cell wall biosynthesis